MGPGSAADRIYTENKNIRFPVDLIKTIRAAAEKKDISFSHFVIEACRQALIDLETDGDDK